MEHHIKNLRQAIGAAADVRERQFSAKGVALRFIAHAATELDANPGHPQAAELGDLLLQAGDIATAVAARSGALTNLELPEAYGRLKGEQYARIARTAPVSPAAAPQRAVAAPVAATAPRQPSPAAAEARRLGDAAVQHTLDAKNTARSMNGKPPLDSLDAALETKIRLDAVAAAGLGRDLDDDPVAAARAFNRHRRS